VLAALDRDKYEVSAIGITPEGQWHRVTDDASAWARQGNVLPKVHADDSLGELALGDFLAADVVFPVLHGRFGEDGTIQGLLDLAGIPYVGSGVLACAATMDKHVTKILLAAADLPVGTYVAITDEQWMREREHSLARIADLSYPLFVKPARAGSSLGIAKVSSLDHLVPAIEQAREHDKKLIVEQSVEGAREIECGVLAGLGYERPRASLCAEITISGDHDFYDFAAKYLDDSATLTVPAAIPEAWHKELGEVAVQAFEAVGCEGLARVDFFVDAEGQPVINEINTMPGFTSISLFPKMWQACGVSYPHLIDHLIVIACQ